MRIRNIKIIIDCLSFREPIKRRLYQIEHIQLISKDKRTNLMSYEIYNTNITPFFLTDYFLLNQIAFLCQCFCTFHLDT